MVVKVGGETDDQYAKEYNVGLLPCGHKSRVLFFVHAPAQARFGLYLCFSDCFHFFPAGPGEQSEITKYLIK